MAKIRQYRPTFVTGFENETVEFDTQKQLLNIKWVKSFSLNHGKRDRNFYRYSLHRDYVREEDIPLIMKLREINEEEIYRHILMAEYDNGYEWWVIGYIDDIGNLDLPNWEFKERRDEI